MIYYCEICDKTLKLRDKKRQLNTKSHKDLSMSIVNRYCVKDPKVDEIKKILRKYVKGYSKIFLHNLQMEFTFFKLLYGFYICKHGIQTTFSFKM